MNVAAAARDKVLKNIGNIVHHSVRVDNDEDNNVVVFKTCQNDAPAPRAGLFNHVDLMRMLDMMDIERGGRIAGGRGYFLKNDGVLLNQAMQSMATGHLLSRGFNVLQTPFFMKKDMMAQCAQLMSLMKLSTRWSRRKATKTQSSTSLPP